MNAFGNAAKFLLFLLLLPTSLNVWAGPPFQTDDPEPVDFRHYEVYAFGSADGTPIEMDSAAPAFEANWGAAPNLQLHIVVPMASIFPSNNPLYFPDGPEPGAHGLGDIELGAKYRFVKETRHRPEIGSFTMLEVPSGSYARGLGIGKVWYKLPVWVQKTWGPWTSYGGAGYEIVPQTGYSNFAYGGWLLQRDLGKKLTLGAEVFSHGGEGSAAPQTRSSTLVDVGGYYYIRKPGWQILFCYGHNAFGQTENYAYLGMYWTWGSDKKKGATAFLAPHL